MARQSIARSLTLSLIAVGLVGLALLLVVIFLDYHLSFGGLADPKAFSRAMHEVSAHVGMPALLIAIPMAIVAWWTVRSALRPIEQAARAVAQSGAAAPGVRIDGADFPAEIAPLADGVNQLLGRMEGLADRNAAFAADVAHELRTPLTLLGLELERLDSPQGAQLQEQVARMQQLVRQLMLIAQLDARGGQQVAGEAVELGQLAARVVAQVAPAVLSAGRTVELEDLGASAIKGESEALAAALRNLIENAVRVTPTGQAVTVIAGPGACLGVADGGPGLTQAELERLADRHVRADHASTGGAGLGLAIVTRIVAAHGGQLLADPELRSITMEFDWQSGPVSSPSV